MASETNIAYVAGLFDGEGSVTYKQYMRKRKHQKKAYPTWSIRMEIAMTDRSVLTWMHEFLKIGTVSEKRYKTRYTKGWKKQWRWRCQFRDAYFFCCLIYPYCHVKMAQVQKIIDHYSKRGDAKMNGKVINLEEYKKAMSLE
tara:strand:- start:863 stop:1288 length:426 start_codon:yes stop_codon:yes gene_type:complete